MKEIGGYFNLELNDRGGFPHDDGILLNSCRNALELVIQSIGFIDKLYIPYYTCDSVIQPIERQSVNYSFYHINESLEIVDKLILGEYDYLLYTNYFGLKNKYCLDLVKQFRDHVIIDNAQALFDNPIENTPTVYSPRKFVGVPDGGIAVNINLSCNFDIDKSWNRCTHLLKRIDEGGSVAYSDFRESDNALDNASIRKMSKLTQSLLTSVDFEFIQERRWSNFNKLYKALRVSNNLKITPDDIICPMVYPYWVNNGDDIRKKLIANKVYVAKYWPNILNWCKSEDFEYEFTEKCLPLPIDQRYNEEDMNRIIEIIKNFN